MIEAMSKVEAQGACNGCTLCCKVMEVDELAKPVGVWCAHCAIGRGCKIYDDRPPTCRGFICGYLAIPGIGDHWYPAKCKMVLYPEENRLVIRVDASRPDVWKSEPFYSELCEQAVSGGSGRQIIVIVGNRSYAIVSDGSVDLGVVESTDLLVTVEYPDTRKWTVKKVKSSDPRMMNIKLGSWISLS